MAMGRRGGAGAPVTGQEADNSPSNIDTNQQGFVGGVAGEAAQQVIDNPAQPLVDVPAEKVTGPTSDYIIGDVQPSVPSPLFTRGSNNDGIPEFDTQGVRSSRYYSDPTDGWANDRNQFIEIFHIPTKRSVYFKSFITGFDDRFQTDYTKESVFGRMDPIATFKRTGRVITLNWDMPATGLPEAKNNMAMINSLIQMLYPVYDKSAPNSQSCGATTMKSGPIFKIKVGNLIIAPGNSKNIAGPAQTKGLSGIVEGFTYKPDLKQGVFDPGDSTGKYDGSLYPKLTTASIRFTVIHDQPVGWEEEGKDKITWRGLGDLRNNRFPYGGDNSTSNQARSIRKPPYVKKQDYRAILDVEKDLIRRRIAVRANRLLKTADENRALFGFPPTII